jgi:hypothetical protein
MKAVFSLIQVRIRLIASNILAIDTRTSLVPYRANTLVFCGINDTGYWFLGYWRSETELPNRRLGVRETTKNANRRGVIRHHALNREYWKFDSQR